MIKLAFDKIDTRPVPAPLPLPIQGPRVPPLVSRAAPLISGVPPLVSGAPPLPGVMTSIITATENREMKNGKDEMCLNLHLTNYLCDPGGPWNFVVISHECVSAQFSSSSSLIMWKMDISYISISLKESL